MAALRVVSVCLLLMAASGVAAQDGGHYDFSIRPGFGGGPGDGLGLRLGLASEVWPSAYFGVGATAALSWQIAPNSGDMQARSIALLAMARTAVAPHYWIFGAGAGYASEDRTPTDEECPDASATCPRHGAVIAVPLVLGWLSHPGRGSLELGPVLRLDLFADPRGRLPTSYVFTINFEIGGALLTP